MSLMLSNVTKRFGEKTAVDNISFSFDKPGVFGLLGTNGAGKTTTIRMILGILQKDTGEISWNGSPVKRETVRFGYLPEERGIYPKAKVGEQLLYFALLKGMDRHAAKKSIDYWLERLEAKEYYNKAAEQLSKGNQQKVQLISAIVNQPELLILDEPFSGLDPINTELFKGVIQELVDQNTFIMMSSHQMPTVEEFCEDIVMLKDGATILSGNLRSIKKSYGRTNLFISCEKDISTWAGQEGMHLKSRTPAGWDFRITSEEQAYRLIRRLLDEGAGIDRFDIREPSLHEIFIEKAGATA